MTRSIVIFEFYIADINQLNVRDIFGHKTLQVDIVQQSLSENSNNLKKKESGSSTNRLT